MAWYNESKRTWLETLSLNVLKNGPIPKHVAFIMDGNRRYAQKVGLPRVQGHAFGFEKLSQTLEWCLDLGITEVTIYTFSIENFKRTKEEVDLLMNMAREKFEKLLNEKEKLNKYGVQLRVFGNLSLLPVDLQQVIAEAVLYTKENTKTYLNVCFAYTSTDEITNAVRDVAHGVVQEQLHVDDVTENLLERCLYLNSSHPDLLVRTSGEVRLSDFLLWQCSFSLLAFFKVLWPEFSIWHLFLAVLLYQHGYNDLKNSEREDGDTVDHGSLCSYTLDELENRNNRQNTFVEYLHAKRLKNLEDMKAGNTVQKTLVD